MNKTVLCLLVGVAVALTVGPAAAQTNPPSDVFTIFDPGGFPLPPTPIVIPEGPGEPALVYTGFFGDPAMVGAPTVFWEGNQNVWSDVFGVVPSHNNEIAIMSDTTETGTGIDPAFALAVFGGIGLSIEEPTVPFDVTMYLNSGMQGSGYHATFYSDGEVPEPSALALLGMGGISLLAYGWRRRG